MLLPMMISTYTSIDSPLGRILLVGSDTGLRGLHLADHERAPQPPPSWQRDDDAFVSVARQLTDYFAGVRTSFDLPLDLSAGTDFQRRVWEQLLAIPYGETISYGELARRIGQPTASRAVGLANGQNPVAIVVPCHRVVAANGGLGGYGWGLDRKSWLLDLERGQQPITGTLAL